MEWKRPTHPDPQAIKAVAAQCSKPTLIVTLSGCAQATRLNLRGRLVGKGWLMAATSFTAVDEEGCITVDSQDHHCRNKLKVTAACVQMDKEGAQPDRVKQELSDAGLLPEEWGGQTPMMPVSNSSGPV